MNILQMASNMKRNGPAMVVFDLAHGLAELGHTVYIAAGYGELVQDINHPNIHFVHIPIDRLQGNKVNRICTYTINGVSTYIQLERLIQKIGIEIINSHQPISNLYAKALSKRMRIPFVTTSHNVYSKGFLTNTYVSGDHVIACSDKVYEHSIKYFHVPAERITCIRNGINPARLKPMQPISYPGKFVIGTLAGLRRQKALDKLIHAFGVFHKMVPNSLLIIAGEGEEEENLKSLTKGLEIEQDVKFLGFRNNVSDVLCGLNVFALSSEYEGLPISMLEAMALRIPVVVTSVGGIPWVIKNEVNGLLCDYGDTEQMANCFYTLYQNRILAKDIAEAGYCSVMAEFSYKKMAENYELIYKKLVM